MTPNDERTRFSRAGYLVWNYLTLASIPDPRERLCSFVAAKTMDELIRIRHLILWMYTCTPESRLALGLSVPIARGYTDVWVGYNHIWAQGFATMAEHWATRRAGKAENRSFWVWDYAPPALIVAFDL